VSGGLVVVTGAAGGIGSTLVEVLTARGYDVLATDRTVPGVGAERLAVDLTDPGCGDALAAAVGDRPLAGLVNNAAASTTTATTDLTVDEWDTILTVNLRAPFLLAEALLPALTAGRGAVVNVSSVHGFETSVGAVPYAASKGGLNALTRALAVDWSARGVPVRVNAVAPAAIDTPMLRDGLARTGTDIAQLGARHPLGRVGTGAEVAAVIAFLLSDDAAYVHGSVLPVDGGALAQLSTEVLD
jgi:NAD(P)-dependent dehydrogenase (short-subunit alcohol dehydrogenase family)